MTSSTSAPPVRPRRGTPEGFASLLEGFRERLDHELAHWLEAKRRTAGAAALGELVDGVSRLANQGGKRLRPALVYYSYRACGGTHDRQVMPLALAMELLHTYLLIHDDIMDHAELRRGLPSAHVRFREAHRARGLRGDGEDFGRSVAILVGDLAHGYAIELLHAAAFEGQLSGSSERSRQRAIAGCFSEMCEEVIGGQYQELLLALRTGTAGSISAAERLESLASTDAELMDVLRLKSGRYTAERPIQLGALLAGADPAILAALSRYGAAVGEAFQLQDDLLGTFGDSGTVGKPVGDDLREGKYTFLVHHALRAASAGQRELLRGALGNPRASEEQVSAAKRVLDETGARARLEEMISARLQAAREALADPVSHHLGDDCLLFFEGLLEYLKERKQ